MVNELLKIQQYTAGLRNLLRRAEKDAPKSAEGSDSTGSVTTELDSTGLPCAIRVDRRWSRRLSPEAFGGAVQEAASAAMNQRLEEWTSSLRQSGWQREFERFQSNPAEAIQPPESPPIPPALRGEAASSATPRPLDVVTEDMMSALDRSDEIATETTSPAEGDGFDSSGRLKIQLSRHRGVTCSAETRWVSEQTAATLMTALSTALGQAKEKLAALEAEGGQQDKGGLDGILAEAMAHLNDPSRSTTEQ